MSQKKSIDYLQDNVYTVQSLLKKRGTDDFLVEWYGFQGGGDMGERPKHPKVYSQSTEHLFSFSKLTFYISVLFG